MKGTLSQIGETANRATRAAPRWLLVAWLVVMLVAAPAAAQTDTATATATPTGGQTAPCETGPPVPGQDSGNDTGTETGELEVVLVSDTSGSMEQALPDLKDAATGFVDNLETEDEAAAVSFDSDTARLDQELTTNHEAVKDAINSYQTSGGTGLDHAITTADTELTSGTNATENASKAMVVLSDGDPDVAQQARDAADSAKGNGITIFTIALGDADEQLMEDIASDPDYAYTAANSSELNEIYSQISGDVQAIGGDLRVETRSLFKPGATHPYEVTRVTYLSDGSTERTDVTENATITTTNETLLSVNDSANTLSAINNSETSTWVRVDATYSGSEGCTNAIVAQSTVENLNLLPNGLWRTNAIISDGFFQALLVALFVGVAVTRYTSAFGGLASGQMVLTIGWFAGYVSWAMAAVSVFVALFIGLNLAANIDYSVKKG